MSNRHIGDLIRDFLKSHAAAQSKANFGDHVSATTTRNGKIVGFSESQGRGRAASGDIDGSGRVSIQIAGTAPRGEEGMLQACKRLVEQLNISGQSWAAPSEVSSVQYIDAVAAGERDFEGRTLTIQVVRALTEPAFWQSLGHTGSSRLSLTFLEAAEAIKAAIELKAQKIPASLRPQLTLLLDAFDVPGLALHAVAEEFERHHGRWAGSLGFDSIWIAGPWREMVSELTSPHDQGRSA